jgi:hypothetical protein
MLKVWKRKKDIVSSGVEIPIRKPIVEIRPGSETQIIVLEENGEFISLCIDEISAKQDRLSNGVWHVFVSYTITCIQTGEQTKDSMMLNAFIDRLNTLGVVSSFEQMK